jgi:hypothetical protein
MPKRSVFMAKLEAVIALVAVSLTFGSVSTAAFAVNKRTLTPGSRDASHTLRMMDKDKNGKVSKKEFLEFMSRRFDRADLNHDRELDRNEMRKLGDRYESFSQGRQPYRNPDRVPLNATTEPQL